MKLCKNSLQNLQLESISQGNGAHRRAALTSRLKTVGRQPAHSNLCHINNQTLPCVILRLVKTHLIFESLASSDNSSSSEGSVFSSNVDMLLTLAVLRRMIKYNK